MNLDKTCAFYQNSRCVYKGAPCDLACIQMGYDEEEDGELTEALPQMEKREFFYLNRGHR